MIRLSNARLMHDLFNPLFLDIVVLIFSMGKIEDEF